MKGFYSILCLFGLVLPYWQFLGWIAENGLAFDQMLAEAAGSRISAFAWLDVVLAAIVLIGFVLHEGRFHKMKNLWLPIAGTCLVGVSFGLPLFLFLRELEIEKHAQLIDPEENGS